MAAEPALTAAELADTAAIAGPDDPTTDSWTPIRFHELPDEPPLQPVLAGTGLLYHGKRHVFSGPPESAKTLAAYAVLILVARSGDTAILIDFEMGPADAKTRLRELGATPDELRRILYVGPSDPATPHRIAALIAHKPVLVVIDAAVGAYQLEGLDDNKRGDVERIDRLYIASFWLNGIATLLIDHVVKNTETRGRFVIGSERKLGGADVHLGFDTIQAISRGTKGRYKITTHKDRVGALKRGHIADLHLDSDPETHEITWTFTTASDDTAEAGYFRPTGLMEKISIHLELQYAAVTRNQVVDALGGTREYMLKAIAALVIEGFVAAEDGPRRSKLVRSVRPYRENDLACNPETPTTSSLVLTSSALVRRTGDSDWFGGSSPVGDVPPESVPDGTTDQLGWFGPNGDLDTGYLDSIAPDPDDDLFT